MKKHNILGKKAETSAVFREKLIVLTAWIFIIFCSYLVFYFSKIGLKTLFLSSNKHFTLERIDISSSDLPKGIPSLVDIDELRQSLQLNVGTDNLFDIDLRSVQKKINEHLCVDSAEVVYRFPNRIKINYTQKSPIARLSPTTLVDKNGFVLPDRDKKLILPVIATRRSYQPGTSIRDEDSKEEAVDLRLKADNTAVLEALDFINFNETFRMSYKGAERFFRDRQFASMEIIKVKSIYKFNEDALVISLQEVPKVFLAEDARLKVPIDHVELGIRRACIAIIQNAMANKMTRKVDARYNSTATE